MKIEVFVLGFFPIWALTPILASAFYHDEVRDAETIQKSFWPKTHLAEFQLKNDNVTLKFGSLEISTFLAELESARSGDVNENVNRCMEVLKNNLLLYEDIIRRTNFGNLSILSSADLDIVTLFNTWGSDVKYALWTLDHWNWVSQDMQCKLASFHLENNETQKTQYCAYEIETGDGNDLKQNLVVGYCVPDSCSNAEATIIGKLLSESVNQFWSSLTPNDTSVGENKISVDCVLSYQTVGWYTRFRSWLVVGSLIILTILTIIASSMYFGVKRNKDNSAAKIFVGIFSVQSHVRKLSHISEQSVGSMNGLKTLTMLFMMYCHVILIRQAFDIDLAETRETFRRNFLGAIMYNATYSVGTFFMLGAALQMLVTLSKFEESKQKRFSPVMWICAVINRYLRLVPLLIFSTALLTEVLPYFNFPLWAYIDTIRRCPGDYWRQLLLVQNLQKINLCAAWTWYLAVDFQLFLLNLPLVCLIQHRPKIGLCLVGVCLILSCIVKSCLVLYYDYPPNLMLLVPIPDYDLNFSSYSFEIYMRPQGWWSSYLIGLAVGYVLFKYSPQRNSTSRVKDIPKIVYWPISALAILFIFWAVFGIYPVANGFKNSVYDALYSGLISVVWASGWGWIVLACHFSPRAKYFNWFLSCRPMVFLSNLTYSCYLIHMPLLFGVFYSYGVWMGGRPRIRFGRGEMFALVSAMTLISYAAAFLINILVEGPAANLQSLVMRAIFSKLFPPSRSKRDDDGRINGDSQTIESSQARFAEKRNNKKSRLRFDRDTAAEDRELEEFSSTSLMRPVERYPIRRI